MRATRFKPEPSRTFNPTFQYIENKRVEVIDKMIVRNGRIKLPKEIVLRFIDLFGTARIAQKNLGTTSTIYAVLAGVSEHTYADLDKYNEWKDALMEC